MTEFVLHREGCACGAAHVGGKDIMLHAQKAETPYFSGNPAADVAIVLRERFGDDALAVALVQHDVAEHEQRAIWKDVIDYLSR